MNKKILLEEFEKAFIKYKMQEDQEEKYIERGSQALQEYYDEYKKYSSKINIQVYQFIDTMDLAYAAADIVISRAGASSISELCIVAKPTILIPSPNVSEDHQTKNAMALVVHNAALLVKDFEAVDKLGNEVLNLSNNIELQEKLMQNIAQLGKADAAEVIANEVISLIGK